MGVKVGVAVKVGRAVGVTVGVKLGRGVAVDLGVDTAVRGKVGVVVKVAVGTAADRPRAAEPAAASRQNSSRPAVYGAKLGKLAFTTALAGQGRL